MDKVTLNGKEYELATYTGKIIKIIDEAQQAVDLQTAYKKQLELVRAAIGDDACKEVLDGTSIDKIDLITLTLVYNEITGPQGYRRRLEEAEQLQAEQSFDSPVFDNLSKIAADVKVINDFGSENK